MSHHPSHVALTPRQDAIVMQPIVALAAEIARIAGALYATSCNFKPRTRSK